MILEGDCLEIMPTLPDKSIDMILCDLPLTYRLASVMLNQQEVQYDKSIYR
jgi:DNA modification methylase